MSEWVNYRIKDIARYIGSGTTPSSNSEKYYADEGYMWVNTGDLNNDLVFDCKQRITDAAIKDYKTLHFYPCNTILEAMYGATIGKVGLLQSPATVNQACCAIVPFEQKVSPKFILYYLIDYKDCLISESCGGTQPNVNQKIVTDIPIKLPSLDTQRRIVSYLDSHVTSIDKRVSLLTTKRDHYLRLKTAIINRAVTQGLNPDVKMKDSGVLGFERIPSNWTVRRFKEVFRHYSTGITPESKNSSFFEDENKGFTWATIADMNKKWIENSNLNLSDKAVSKFSPILTRKGSLLFSFKLSVGKIAFAGKDMYTNEAIVSILPNSHYCLEFFYYLLPKVLSLNTTENIYGAKMLNQKIIANIQLPLPPLSEQQAIATYLGEKCTKIDAIVENLNQQIEKHKLLKRALINEVITGQRAV